jgi:hypothetical protein
LICQEHYSSPEKRKSIWQYTTFLFIERAAWTNSLPYEDALIASLIFFDSFSDWQNEVMKSIDPSDAFNSLAPSVPDYNKIKNNLSHFTRHSQLYESMHAL